VDGGPQLCPWCCGVIGHLNAQDLFDRLTPPNPRPGFINCWGESGNAGMSDGGLGNSSGLGGTPGYSGDPGGSSGDSSDPNGPGSPGGAYGSDAFGGWGVSLGGPGGTIGGGMTQAEVDAAVQEALDSVMSGGWPLGGNPAPSVAPGIGGMNWAGGLNLAQSPFGPAPTLAGWSRGFVTNEQGTVVGRPSLLGGLLGIHGTMTTQQGYTGQPGVQVGGRMSWGNFAISDPRSPYHGAYRGQQQAYNDNARAAIFRNQSLADDALAKDFNIPGYAPPDSLLGMRDQIADDIAMGRWSSIPSRYSSAMNMTELDGAMTHLNGLCGLVTRDLMTPQRAFSTLQDEVEDSILSDILGVFGIRPSTEQVAAWGTVPTTVKSAALGHFGTAFMGGSMVPGALRSVSLGIGSSPADMAAQAWSAVDLASRMEIAGMKAPGFGPSGLPASYQDTSYANDGGVGETLARESAESSLGQPLTNDQWNTAYSNAKTTAADTKPLNWYGPQTFIAPTAQQALAGYTSNPNYDPYGQAIKGYGYNFMKV